MTKINLEHPIFNYSLWDVLKGSLINAGILQEDKDSKHKRR